ncbi:MAG: NAD(P)H-hydrate dehydratase [Candidatus Methylomirabilia bacterium]
MKLATAGEMAAVDHRAAECHGLAVAELMDRAGRCTADAAELLLGPVRDRRVALFCGRGNNGGDGFVAARALRARGAQVRLILVGDPGDLRPDARRAWDAARAAGVDFAICADTVALAATGELARAADLVVDALLGTGFAPPARGLAAAAISLINALGRPVLAVDIPSGLAADHGRVVGEAVRATATVTFGYPKPGLVVHPAARHVGRLWLADIGFPPETGSLVAGELNLVTADDLRTHAAPRDPESHKGTFGHVLLVAGSRGMVGAAALAARGALRAGAGLVTIALPSSIAPSLFPGLPEVMLLPLPEEPPPGGGRDAAATIIEQFSRVSALAAGPGLSRGDGPSRLVHDLCAAAQLPLLLDADALHALAAAGPPAISVRNTPAVLTPHPGELARLIGTSAAEVQADRIGAARACAGRFNAVVVLKGSRTVVAPPVGPLWINPTGNPAMAAAGMGDVLAGVISAHLARGMAPLPAALLGVYLHGLAGDLAVADRGPWGILASEVADRIPAAVHSLGNRDAAPAAKLSLLVP